MALVLVVEECPTCETVRVGETDCCDHQDREVFEVELPFGVGLVMGTPAVLTFKKKTVRR